MSAYIQYYGREVTAEMAPFASNLTVILNTYYQRITPPRQIRWQIIT